MYEAIEGLRRKAVPVREGRYLIGLSGGADSTALLLMIARDVRSGRITAEAVHVNHGLRGGESDGDERFCRELCEQAGIPLSVFRAELHARTDEASARTARFAAFRQRYAEYGADALILAHQADDQAETFVMRLMRGAGPEGLGCMKEEETVCGIRILRPMLSIRRGEIRDALRADGVPWREDSSNASAAYLRNRIRMEVLPAMEAVSGSAVGKICRAACLTAGDNEVLNAQAEELLRRLSEGRRIDAGALAREPAALRSRALRIWWLAHAPGLKEHTLNAEQTEAFDGLLRNTRGKINLPGGMHAVRSGRFLFLSGEPVQAPEPVEAAGPETVFGDYCLTVSASEGSPGDGKRTQEVPEGFVRGCVIRTRRPGDRIRPFGGPGSRKLQDYLTDRRIPEPFRDRIPLLCRDNEVLLAGGVGAGAVPPWNPELSPVRLTWHGDMPWMES